MAEAVPILVLAVRSLERSMVEWRTAGHAIACIVAWQILPATWESLRFDDCLHDRSGLFATLRICIVLHSTEDEEGPRPTWYKE